MSPIPTNLIVLYLQIDKLTKELETARSSGGNPKADERNISTSSVEELNRTPLMPSGNPASMNAIIPNGMGMFPSKIMLLVVFTHYQSGFIIAAHFMIQLGRYQNF